jgi:hypothetical protein
MTPELLDKLIKKSKKYNEKWIEDEKRLNKLIKEIKESRNDEIK